MELAAGYAEDVADLRTIPRLIETGALHEAAEVVDCLDTLVRDQISIRLYDAIVPGTRRAKRLSTANPLARTPDGRRSTPGRWAGFWNHTGSPTSIAQRQLTNASRG